MNKGLNGAAIETRMDPRSGERRTVKEGLALEVEEERGMKRVGWSVLSHLPYSMEGRDIHLMFASRGLSSFEEP